MESTVDTIVALPRFAGAVVDRLKILVSCAGLIDRKTSFISRPGLKVAVFGTTFVIVVNTICFEYVPAGKSDDGFAPKRIKDVSPYAS